MAALTSKTAAPTHRVETWRLAFLWGGQLPALFSDVYVVRLNPCGLRSNLQYI